MSHRIHPYGFRLGITKDWISRWYADKKTYPDLVLEDERIRKFLTKKLDMAGVESINIERSVNSVDIYIRVSKPGVVIGRDGGGVEALEKELKKITTSKLRITAEAVKVREIEAQLVADYIARQLQRRVNFRKAAMYAVESAMSKGAKGVKVRLSGVLGGGNTIGRTEKFTRGAVPLQTLRANIDYAQVHCQLLYGVVGVKVWIYKGENK